MNNINKVGPVGTPSLSTNRSHIITMPEHLTTFNASELVPIFCFKTLPGGTYKIDLGTITRLPALKHPVMGKLFLDCYAFFVPYDLLDEKFEKLISEGHDNTFIEALYGRGSHNPNPQSIGASIVPDLYVPHIEKTPTEKMFKVELGISTSDPEQRSSRLLNYLGLPATGPAGYLKYNEEYDENLSAYPIRAYNLIYSCHFRHPFLQNPLVTDFNQPVSYLFETDKETGEITGKRYQLLDVNRTPDFFSKGFVASTLNSDLDISIGLDDLLPIVGDSPYVPVGILVGKDGGDAFNREHVKFDIENSRFLDYFGTGPVGDTSGDIGLVKHFLTGNPHTTTSTDDDLSNVFVPKVANIGAGNFSAKLNGAVSFSINQFRQAVILNHISERALYGTDMKTILRASFSLDLPDYKLDEPLFIGGRRVPIQINQVTNTSNTLDAEGNLVVPTGEYAGQSTTIDNLSGVNGDNMFVTAYNFGLIMVLVCVRHESVYQQGISPIFTEHDKFDFYWPEFAGMSNIPIKKKYIWRSGHETSDNRTFNFNRYGIEYVSDPNRVSGAFSTGHSTPLDDWHLADWYDSEPYFSSDWIKDTTRTVLSRALAIQTGPQFVSYFRATFTRDIPVANVVPGVTRI